MVEVYEDHVREINNHLLLQPAMKSLVCAVIGDGKLFVVRIEGFLKAGDLASAIKEQRASVISCEAADMTLFLAKKGPNWLKESDADAKILLAGHFPPGILRLTQNEENSMSPARRIGHTAFGFPNEDDEDAEDDVIHVLVAIPRIKMRDTPMGSHPARKRRWDQLNEVFDSNKREKQTETGDSSLPVDEIHRVLGVKSYEQPSKSIPDEKLTVLHEYLSLLAKAYGFSVDVELVHFTFPVLVCACSLFDDVRIRTNVRVGGGQVSWNGTFDFVLERGGKFVCVVDAKYNLRQGLGRAYVGSEAFAESKGLAKVYSIVTCFRQWFFLKSLNGKPERSHVVSIAVEDDIPTRESVKDVVGKIYAMLSEDD